MDHLAERRIALLEQRVAELEDRGRIVDERDWSRDPHFLALLATVNTLEHRLMQLVHYVVHGA
jgi:hypothetical protein